MAQLQACFITTNLSGDLDSWLNPSVVPRLALLAHSVTVGQGPGWQDLCCALLSRLAPSSPSLKELLALITPKHRVTFTVAIVIHLYLGASEAGITVQLTVVQVRLAIATAHRPLVRFAFLCERSRENSILPASSGQLEGSR